MMYGGHHHGGGFRGGGTGRFHGAFDDDLSGVIFDRGVIKRLPGYLAPVKGWLALGATGMVAASLGTLSMPYLIALGTDNYIQTGNLNGLTIIALVFLGMALIVWGGQYAQTLFLSYAGQSVLLRMRTEMFDHLQELSMSFFDRGNVGALISRVQSDVQQLQQLLTQGILELLTSVLTLVGIAVVMLTMNLRLGLLALTVVPVMGIAVFIWQKYARTAFTRARRAIAVVTTQFQEGISGVRVTQSLSREEVNLEQFDGVNRQNLSANIDAGKVAAAMRPVAQIMTAIGTALIIFYGGAQVLAGAMGVGVLVGFLLYIQRFFQPVIEMSMQYTEFQRAMASAARIFELLDVEPEIKDSPQATEVPTVKGEIKFDQVSFSYQSDVEVLSNINLIISPGENVAIVGQTGAGKSSIANLIARFYDVSSGSVSVDGYDVRSVTIKSLRRQIGIVPQDPFLFSGSIEDNIRYGHPEATHEDVVNVAKMVGAHEFITRLEGGYDALVGERGGNLSAGQRQFICLARALLSDPPILILDEATSNVDTNTERLIQKSLSKLSKRRTCLIIAHRLSTVTNTDRIIVLEKGNIIEAGSHRELMAEQGKYYQMFEALSAPSIK